VLRGPNGQNQNDDATIKRGGNNHSATAVSDISHWSSVFFEDSSKHESQRTEAKPVRMLSVAPSYLHQIAHQNIAQIISAKSRKEPKGKG